MSIRRGIRAGAVAALLLAASLPAMAAGQERGWWPNWNMGQGMMGGWGMGTGMMGFGGDAPLERIDGRLAFLKTELKITPQQSSAWDDLARVVRDTSEVHNKMMREMMKEVQDGSFFDKPLPERLQYQQTRLEARVEQIRAVREAVDRLYAVLDAGQRKAADEIVLPMMGMGMGRGMMGRGMMFGD